MSESVAHLDCGVLGNNARARARGVQEGTVHAVGAQHLKQLATVVVGHDGVGDPHALQVALDGLEAQRVDLIRKYNAAVAHQRRYVRCLAA